MPEHRSPLSLSLFIVKSYSPYPGDCQVSNGLKIATEFLVEMLKRLGYNAKMVEAIDADCIERLVVENKPARAIIEALWVTPAKLRELKKLYPKIEWVVRIHSEIPFLASEGIGIAWIDGYLIEGVKVAFNSKEAAQDFEILGKTTYLPDYYPSRDKCGRLHKRNHIDIGCFGAIRPLKNQLIQAFAAVEFAACQNKKLHFHMNGAMYLPGTNPDLKSIQSLMDATRNELVLHPWLCHEEFLELVKTMDICMQVSLSESFNICSADAVSQGVPLVGSTAVRWLPAVSKANPGDVQSIVAVLHGAEDPIVKDENTIALLEYSVESEEVWTRYMWSA